MNILIVDDLVSVVNGIIKGVDWSELGILGIYKAHNAYEAKVLIDNLNIDILLTDIEMPGENGLDLVEWVRNNHLDMACIFMSSHADFDYARRAIRSGGYSYVLLPCPYDEIKDAVRGAAQQLRLDRRRKKMYEYGKIVSEDVWFDNVILGEALEKGKNKRAVEKLIELGRITLHTCGYLCKLYVYEQSIDEDQWDGALMEFTLNNVISELMAPLQHTVLMYQENIREYWFFCYNKENTYIAEQNIFERQVNLIMETMKGILRLSTQIQYEYCENPGMLAQIHQEIQSRTVTESEKGLLLDQLPNNRWLQYYNTKDICHLEKDVSDWLGNKMKEESHNSSAICIRLHTDLIQLMYKYLNQYNDSIFSVFETRDLFERYIHSYKSPDELKWFVSKLQTYIKKRCMPEMEIDNPVELVTRYIQEHIAQDIKRSDLADYVHLNIDYLSRIFKREKGVTLNDYIISEKMSVAKNLIITTRLPVSLIAVKVGYSNFSYFSKIYKKIYGCSPVQEREKA